MHAKYVPTKDLFQALIRAKRAFRDEAEEIASRPDTEASLRVERSQQDALEYDRSSHALREGLACESD
jgi:hypothetical protein